MENRYLREYIDKLCDGMKFENDEKKEEFKTRLEDVFFKHEELQKRVLEMKSEKRGKFYPSGLKGKMESMRDDHAIDKESKARSKTLKELESMIYATSSKQISIDVHWGGSVEASIQRILNNMREEHEYDVKAAEESKKESDKSDEFCLVLK